MNADQVLQTEINECEDEPMPDGWYQAATRMVSHGFERVCRRRRSRVVAAKNVKNRNELEQE